MHLDGYWVEDGPGYNPKYRSAVWSLILLSQLGASAEVDSCIQKACQHYLNSALSINYPSDLPRVLLIACRGIF